VEDGEMIVAMEKRMAKEPYSEQHRK